MKINSKYSSSSEFSDDKYTKGCSLTSLMKSRLMCYIRRRTERYSEVRPDGLDSSLMIIGRKESHTLRQCDCIVLEMLCRELLLNRKLLQVPPERSRSGYRYGAMRFALLHLAKSISYVNYNDKQCA